MSSAADMAERHTRTLAALSELALGLAANLQARALAAEDDETAARLAAAFHQVARSARQSMALESKLARDRDRAAREARDDARSQHALRVQARRARLRTPLEREIRAIFHGYDAQNRCREMEERLDVVEVAEDFLDGDVEAMIARLRIDLRLAGAPQDDDEDYEDEDEDGYEADDPPEPDEPPADNPWRSSG